MNAGQKVFQTKPPDKGSFPLDHDGKCHFSFSSTVKPNITVPTLSVKVNVSFQTVSSRNQFKTTKGPGTAKVVVGGGGGGEGNNFGVLGLHVQ